MHISAHQWYLWTPISFEWSWYYDGNKSDANFPKPTHKFDANLIVFVFAGAHVSAPLKRSASTGATQQMVTGDLMSGRAFDSGCRCHQSSEGVINDLVGRQTECHCGAPRLSPQLEFIKALMNIGKKLQQLPTKELRSKRNRKWKV